MSYVPTRKDRFDDWMRKRQGLDALLGLASTAVLLFVIYVGIQLVCVGLDAAQGNFHGWLAHVTYWPTTHVTCPDSGLGTTC